MGFNFKGLLGKIDVEGIKDTAVKGAKTAARVASEVGDLNSDPTTVDGMKKRISLYKEKIAELEAAIPKAEAEEAAKAVQAAAAPKAEATAKPAEPTKGEDAPIAVEPANPEEAKPTPEVPKAEEEAKPAPAPAEEAKSAEPAADAKKDEGDAQ